ncbi:hormogonium polysaccharide secretion pseudopilin HpsC [Anabaena sp. UHCC 0451]|uniref:hormogonium polysaccharide secretion pseudopilin HpsC n=1 Tax=Anabaena sp. UHCC 0451 TaxID=2055235 RepID=UPI002B21383B|nr:hormogonium polysaccharide secretion pseudopilin HpsC [Anabaena sp. UHCC 0451]MEA5575418.1 hormogonium polysaccharide secretion pseudopilin HpsC [Anabaena sp. UHCC 0451]
MNTLKLILTNNIKSQPSQHKNGFTLIELLVGLVMSFTIITSLLGFMLNVMETDKKEQAKVNSEQEIQAALDYISRDLQQAVYIYDANGIDAIKNQLPSIPNGIDRVPVLVFWQRELITEVLPSSGAGKDDAFVYSLVVYYLIRDTKSSGSNWSKIARIGKWKIRDGVLANTTDANKIISCTGYPDKYIKGSSSNPDEFCPSNGFAPFDLNQKGTLEEIMNGWKRGNGAYTTNTLVLVDYIDQTTNNPPPAICPPNSINPNITWSKVTPASFNQTETGKMTSFYACIDRLNTTAQLFIRGNALARLNNNSGINYSANQKTYFPTTNIRVQGRGNLYK